MVDGVDRPFLAMSSGLVCYGAVRLVCHNIKGYLVVKRCIRYDHKQNYRSATQCMNSIYKPKECCSIKLVEDLV